MNQPFDRRDVPAQPVVALRGQRSAADFPAFIGESIMELFARLGVLGVAPAGPPFVVYHAFGPDGVDAEACVPVAVPVSASGRIEARVLPAATVVSTLHLGPYETLGETYAELEAWIAGHGLQSAGPYLERYLNGPDEAASPADYRTEVEIPVAEAPVPVG